MTIPGDELCICGHSRAWHTGCGPGFHAGSPHEECCAGDDPKERCNCTSFEAQRASGEYPVGLFHVDPPEGSARLEGVRYTADDAERVMRKGLAAWVPATPGEPFPRGRTLSYEEGLQKLADAGMLGSRDMANLRARKLGYKDYADFMAHMPQMEGFDP